MEALNLKKENNDKQALQAKYRDAYIKDAIIKSGIEEPGEVSAGLDYVRERLNEDDGNLDEAVTMLGASFKVDEREPPKDYVDPSAGNGARLRPVPYSGYDKGLDLYNRIKNKGGK